MLWCVKYVIKIYKYTRTKENWTKNKNNFVSQKLNELAKGYDGKVWQNIWKRQLL